MEKKVYDPMCNRAKTQKRYIGAWSRHITEFTSVLLESGMPVDQWDATLQPLRDALNKAANKLEADGYFE